MAQVLSKFLSFVVPAPTKAHPEARGQGVAFFLDLTMSMESFSITKSNENSGGRSTILELLLVLFILKFDSLVRVNSLCYPSKAKITYYLVSRYRH